PASARALAEQAARAGAPNIATLHMCSSSPARTRLSNFELAACAASSASRGATSPNNALDGRDQPIELDRLGIQFVASPSDRLVTLASERMGGERNDWNITGLRIVA